ncbi:MAG: DNA translocase FtsK 4TM domain-containing protein, partial [Anaerolineae bacterium]|nr:DNA translocase FtsK 4TM domain-containing protein [Anaerolineae bacterium]
MPPSKSKRSSKRKSKGKPKGKKPVSRSASKKQKAPAPAEGPRQGQRAASFWGALSIDRKLDVIGIIVGLGGLLTLLSLISAERSALTGNLIRFLEQVFGWGIFILPIGLIAVGLWLILRNIESVPTFSIERITGILVLFLWLLAAMHLVIVPPELAEQAALDGVAGGYIGSLFERLLWFGLGFAGTIISMTGWFLIGLTLILDIPIRDFFKWVGPIINRIRIALTPAPKAQKPAGEPLGSQMSAATPIQRPPGVVGGPQNGGLVSRSSAIQPAIEWVLPALKDILDPGSTPEVNEEFLQQRARLIEETLASFSAPAKVVEINRGPSITQFGVEPLFVKSKRGRTRVRVNKIAALADDLALALSAPRIRIQAPVPGRGFVGIEVPNDEMTLVALHDLLESEAFQRKQAPLSFALGRDVAGQSQIAILDSMPHLLIAGTTGSGKSVCVNSILTSFLLYNTPDDLKLVLVDPKRVELTGYNGIPHLLSPVVVDVDKVVGVLQWMTREMDKRYHTFAKIGARNIGDYNARMKIENGKKMPFLVIVIDELADLMMTV